MDKALVKSKKGEEHIHCFHCENSLEGVAAYLTQYRFPVCSECLPKLCEDYRWDQDSLKLQEIRRGRLEHLRIRSPEELEYHLRVAMAPIPILLERRSTLNRPILTKLAAASGLRTIL